MRKITFFILILFLLGCSARNQEYKIKVMSYNVRHGVSMNWNPSMMQQSEIINQQNPDWVGLQEIDNKCGRSQNIDQTEKFEVLTNRQGFFGKFMDFDSGEYGMATLSSLKIVKSERLKLPQGAEPRIAIIQIISIAKNLYIAMVNVHFDWTKSELRIAQVKTLLNRLDEINLPTIVIGDYNAEPGSPTLKLFEKSGFVAVRKKGNNFTFAANNPTIEIDHIYFRKTPTTQIIPSFIKVLNEPEASDHRPIVSEFIIKMN